MSGVTWDDLLRAADRLSEPLKRVTLTRDKFSKEENAAFLRDLNNGTNASKFALCEVGLRGESGVAVTLRRGDQVMYYTLTPEMCEITGRELLKQAQQRREAADE